MTGDRKCGGVGNENQFFLHFRELQIPRRVAARAIRGFFAKGVKQRHAETPMRHTCAKAGDVMRGDGVT